MALRVPSVRAVARHSLGDQASLTFSYRGPSSTLVPLASGELRRQVGIKLRAKDTCNVVYVMWQLAPLAQIAVSVKSNPGMTSHAQCRDGGYLGLPVQSQPPPVLVGEQHTLAATIEGRWMTVFADGNLVWHGILPKEAFAFSGQAGFRSDNGVFDVVFDAHFVNTTAPSFGG